MSAPAVVVLGSVSQGYSTTPTIIWISPDRNTATDSSVRRVKKFEDNLTSSILETGISAISEDVLVGRVVAVRRDDKYVRGEVVEILTGDTKVRVLLTDWGEVVDEISSNLRNIPTTINYQRHYWPISWFCRRGCRRRKT